MQQNREFRGGQCALCVLSCLLLVLGMLLGHLFTASQHDHNGDPTGTAHASPDSADDSHQGGHASKGVQGDRTLSTEKERSKPWSSTTEADFSGSFKINDATVQMLDSQSLSLTGRQCGEDKCSSQYEDVISDVLVTSDRQVVVGMYYAKSLLVDSQSGVKTVTLPCHPKALAEVPTGLIAVTCYFTPVILLVNASSPDDPVQQIRTEKLYRHVAANPEDNTLLVSFRSLKTYRHNDVIDETNSIDVLTAEGKFLRTLVDHHVKILHTVTSLSVRDQHVIMTNTAEHVLKIALKNKDKPEVEILTKEPGVLKAVSDKAGNVFMVKLDEAVSRSAEGRYRQLMEKTEKETDFEVFDNVAVCDDRLVVVTRALKRRQSRLFQYRLV